MFFYGTFSNVLIIHRVMLSNGTSAIALTFAYEYEDLLVFLACRRYEYTRRR